MQVSLRNLAHNAPPPAGNRHWLWPRRWRVVLGLAIAFAIWGWLDVRQRGVSDPARWWEQKTDLTVYTEAGAAFFDQRDPYAVTNLRGWKYLYLPLFAIVMAPLHALDPHDQVFAWFVVSVLLGWGCYLELVRIARRVLPPGEHEASFGPIPTWLGIAGATAAMLPALNCLQRGQVGVAKLYLLLLGFRWLIESRSWARAASGGTALAMAVALKITPLVPAAIVLGQLWTAVWQQHARAALRRATAGTLGTAAGLAACVLFVPGLLIGWQANLNHLSTWWTTVAVRMEKVDEQDFAGDSTSVRNQSLTNATHRLGNWLHHLWAAGPPDTGSQHPERRGGPEMLMNTPLVDRALLLLRAAAGCLAVAVGYKMGRRHDPLGQAASFGLACAATLVLFTIARGHYYVMLLPGVVFPCLWLLHAGRTKTALALAIVPGVLVIGHYAAMDYTGRVGLLGLGTAAWYAATCAALLWPQGRLTIVTVAAPIEEPAMFQIAQRRRLPSLQPGR